MAVALPSAVHDTVAGVAALLAVDPHDSTPEQQLAVMETLLTLGSQLHAATVHWTAAVDASEITALNCGSKTRAYLIEGLHLDPGDAHRLMRLSRALPTAPLTDKALSDGDINQAHALLITKVLRHVKDDALREVVEVELVELARNAPPYLVARAVDRLLVMLGVESAKDAHERRFGERGVGVDETFGGTGSLNGTLTAELREKLRVFFTAFAGRVGTEDTRTQRQRNHDALEELVDFGLAHMGNLSPVDGERPRVYAHIDYRHLMGLLEDHEAVATLGSGVVVPAAAARRLACDMQLIPVVLGANSEVLDIGSISRHPTSAITRATFIRDGGACTFPGCQGKNLRQHHMDFWSQWHTTSYDVMAWVCSFHHWLVHEGGWSMRRENGNLYIWTAPDGHEVRTRPPRQPQAA